MSRLLSLFALTVAFLATPLLVSAQGGQGIVPCTGPDCQLNDLIDLINRGVDFIIVISVFVAVLSFVWAGFQLLTSAGNQAKYEQAKRIIMSALIGLLIVLGAWLIVNTVLYALTGTGFEGWGIREAAETAVERPDLPEVAVMPIIGSSGGVFVQDPGTGEVFECVDMWCSGMPIAGADGQLTHAAAQAMLAANGNITLWASGGVIQAECPTSGGCTSLNNINTNVIHEVLRIQQACGCAVTVTGGTESGHSTSIVHSHGNGYKIDLDDTPALDAYLKNYGTPAGYRGDGAALYTRGCNIYALEDDHWDITVRNC